ncbi:MAG TPA: hypothetical protein VH062_06435 [Polyangiaceae bacterium]|jgi:hypothetical protein|nr:hypothetical protein [Polyangiaceae bacterium]
MKDPARLLDEGATAAELSLLRAGMSEEPSEQAMKRLSVALGLASGASVSTIALKSGAASAAVRGTASRFAAKWLLWGALGASGAALVVAETASVHRTVATSPPGAATHEDVIPPAPVVTAPAPVVTALPEAPTTPVVAVQSPVRGSPSIAKEIAALDVARQRLGGGNPRGALRALDDYDRAAPTGVLRQEAALLRIEAFARAGDLGTARRLASRFLREHPKSPHEKRIRALVGETP